MPVASWDLQPHPWSAEQVLAALTAAGAARGRWWTQLEWVQAQQSPAVSTVYQWCGSWTEAWTRAGYPPPARWRLGPKPDYTRDQMLAALQAAAQSTPHLLTSTYYDRWRRGAGGPTLSTVRQRLGTWAESLRQAGLIRPEPTGPAAVVASVVALAHELGRPPSAQDWRQWPARPVPLPIALTRWGGSWSDLANRARQSDAAWPIEVSRSEAVEHLLSLPEERLTARQRDLAALFRAGHTLESAGVLWGLTRERVRQIASKAGRPAAGRPGRRAHWTPGAAEARMVAWLDAHDATAPTVTQWLTAGERPTPTTIAQLFGSWRDAWATLGPAAMPRRGRAPLWTRAALADHLRAWAAAHGDRAPTISEWSTAGGKPSAYLIMQTFGTWRKAWRTAAPSAQLPKLGRRRR